MRKRFGLATILAGLMAIAIGTTPAVASGQSYMWIWYGGQCFLNGGAYGEGYVKARFYMEENGYSGTNYFQAIGRLQQWNGSRWVNIDSKAFYTNSFPNNADTHYWNKTIKLAVFDNSYYHRIAVTMQWWDQRQGPDHLLYQKTKKGPQC